MTEQEKTKRELFEDLWVAHRGSAQLADENECLRARLRATEQALDRQRDDDGQAQRSEVCGRLVGDVAHDFNNVLTIIAGFSEILLADTMQNEQSRRLLNEIRGATGRAVALTQRLFSLSRTRTATRSKLDVNAVVKGITQSAHRLIGERATLTTRLEPILAQTCADPGQLEEIILHLIIHARDAVAPGGKLTLSTRNVINPPVLSAGSYVQLDVSTQRVAEQTGVSGLTAVMLLARENRGTVSVEHLPSAGLTFRLLLPAVDAAPVRDEDVPRGGETILLVDDEDCVRSIARQALQIWGYTVLEATGGAEALRICAQHEGEIAMVVTDVRMPEIPGPQLVKMLHQRRPGLKVLYLSGYAPEAAGVQADADLLPKPFTPTILGQKVREVLDR